MRLESQQAKLLLDASNISLGLVLAQGRPPFRFEGLRISDQGADARTPRLWYLRVPLRKVGLQLSLWSFACEAQQENVSALKHKQ